MTDDHVRFIQARQTEFELSSQLAERSRDKELWSAWSIATAAVDAIVANLELSDEEVHSFDLQIQALKRTRPQSRQGQAETDRSASSVSSTSLPPEAPHG